MGRPPVRADLKRDKRLIVMLTESESDALSAAADRAGARSLSDWIRGVLLEAAEKP